jgi:hypothetical protein
MTGPSGWTRTNLDQCAVWLREKAGTVTAVSGLARGFDLWWGAAAVRAGLDLWAMIPFEEQPDGWKDVDQAEWRRLRAAAARETVVGALAGAADRRRRAIDLYHARNDAMLEVADAVVTGWEPHRRSGGTHSALLKAARRGMPGIHLDPARPGVRFQLPTLAELQPRRRAPR